jgi:hypothetical protein
MDNVQKHNSCNNIPSSQTFKSYFQQLMNVLTEVTMKGTVFCDVRLYSPLEAHWCFEELTTSIFIISCWLLRLLFGPEDGDDTSIWNVNETSTLRHILGYSTLQLRVKFTTQRHKSLLSAVIILRMHLHLLLCRNNAVCIILHGNIMQRISLRTSRQSFTDSPTP